MAGRFLAVAAVAVIALLGGLWFLMNDGEEPVAQTTPRDAVEVAVAPPEEPAPVEPTVKRTITPPVMLKRPTRQPEFAAPSAGTVTPLVTDDAAVKPPTISEALKEQVMVTETQVLECNDKALKAGKTLDGEAAFGFTIARKDGKIVIESTGVEYTNFDKPTSDCFRETANAMIFDTLPEGVEAMTAYRKVVFAGGALKRQWMTDSHVVRPPPPPAPPKP